MTEIRLTTRKTKAVTDTGATGGLIGQDELHKLSNAHERLLAKLANQANGKPKSKEAA